MHPDRPHFDGPPPAPPPGDDAAADVLPPQGYVFGVLLFIATLTMLFAASMIGYAIIRVRLADPAAVPERLQALPLGQMRPPLLLFLSTALILASSVAVHYAADALRKDRLRDFRKGLTVTLVLAVGFIAVQAPSMWMLLHTHREHAAGATWLYGFVFFLVLVHALHVLGGLIPLCVIAARAARDRYHAAADGPVRALAYYWHFLDAVWIVMFCLFMVLG